MPQFRIESPDGRWMVVEGATPPSQQDADMLFKQHPYQQQVPIDNQSKQGLDVNRANRIAIDNTTTPLPAPGLFGQIGQSFKGTLGPLPAIEQAKPTTMLGGFGKEVGQQLTVPNLAMLLGAGKVFQGLGDMTKLGGQAAKQAQFGKAAIAAPFVTQGLSGLAQGVPQLLENWANMPPAERGSEIAKLAGNTALASPLALTEGAVKSGLNAIDVLGRGQKTPLPTALRSRTAQAPVSTGRELTSQEAPVAPASIKPTAALTPDVRVRKDFTPEDLTEWNRLDAAQRLLMKAGNISSPEFTSLFQAKEALKNKYGGMPPKQFVEGQASTPKLTDKELFDKVHQFANDFNSLNTGLYADFKQGKVTKEQYDAINKKTVDAMFRLRTSNDIEQAQKDYNQIQTEVQNASRKPSTERVPLRQQGQGMGKETSLQQQGSATGARGQSQEVPSNEPKGKVETKVQPVRQVSTGARRGDVQGDERLKNLQAIPEKNRNEWQNKEIRRLLGNQGVSGQSGMIGFGGTVDLSKLGLKTGENKVSGEQLLGRVRNVLGEKSAQFGALEGAGLGAFLKQPRSLPELKTWIEQNAPRVEVRKFGEGIGGKTRSENELRSNEIVHELETLGYSVEPDEMSGEGQLLDRNGMSLDKPLDEQPERVQNLFNELVSIPFDQERQEVRGGSQSHWQSIAPKSEKDMPGYVEIAVVKPQGRIQDQHNPEHLPEGRLEQPQFPSSHNFPPNTLGFVRGYMETLPSGEKVFHVIEVQSDWAQRERELKEKGDKYYGEGEMAKRSPEQLLSHYERLALKAAIDHARSEGATKIAISDAETAMMTEGHDRAVRITLNPTEKNVALAKELEFSKKAFPHLSRSVLMRLASGKNAEGLSPIESIPYKEKGFEVPQPDALQAPGMRLHYDRTLPKIAEELTGDKGQKVSFGEHRMAVGDQDTGIQIGNTVFRRDLIFRNEAGQPKTDVSARVYDISKAKKPFSLYGRSGSVFPKAESTGKEPTKMLGPDAVVSKALGSLDSRTAKGSDIVSAVLNSAFMNRRRGYDFPAMQSANPELANKAAKYGNAAIVGRLQAQSNIAKLGEGLPKDEGFWKRVGAVIYEDMRRAGGSEGNSVFDLKNTPLPNEAAYQSALKDPNVRKAIEQWKENIQEPAKQMHVQLGGSLLDVGEETGAFANLKALFEDQEPEFSGTSPQSGPLASLRGRTAFGQQRKYSGQEYVYDARELGYRMLTKNFAKVEKDNFYKALEESGQGKLIKQKSEAPAGMEVLENPVRMRTVITEKDGKTTIIPQNEWLAINPKLLPETSQLLQVNKSWGKILQEEAPWVYVANQALLKVQVGLGIDLGFHAANDFAATLQAFKYNVPRAALSTTRATVDYIRKDPKVQEEILNMAKEGVTFRGENVAGWGSRSLRFVDTVTRLVLNREYERGVEKGRFVDSPAERRRYINARAGQYNKRFMTYLQQSFQETTIGAFNVAGRNFNRLSVRAMLGTPGAKAPSVKQATLNRLAVGTGLAITALVLPAVYNEAKWNDPEPKGTRPGEFAIRKNPDGSYLTEDMFKLTLLSRAGRATGLGPLMSEQVMPRLQGEQTPPLEKTLEHSGMEAGATMAQPFWGPTLSVLSSLGSGNNMGGYGFNTKTPGEEGPPYWRAALSSVNPIAGPVASAPEIAPSETKNVLGGVVKRLGGILGIKDSQKSFSQVQQWAAVFKQRNNLRGDGGNYSPTEYGPLKTALLSGNPDEAKQAYQQLLHVKSQRGDMSDEEAQQHAREDMQKYFDHLGKFNFVNKDDEAKFKAGLTPKQREVYNEAQQQLKDMSTLFFEIQPKEQKRRGPGLRLNKSLGHL